MRTAAVICLATACGFACAQPPPASPPGPNGFHGGFRTLRTIETDGDRAGALTFAPDSKALLIGDGKAVRFVDPRTGKPAADPWKVSGDVRFLAFLDASTLAVVCEPRTAVSLRQYPSGKELAVIDLGKDAVAALACAGGAVAVATGGPKPVLRYFAGPKWAEAWRVELPASAEPPAVAIDPHAGEVLTCSGGASGALARPCAHATATGGRVSHVGLMSVAPESAARLAAGGGRWAAFGYAGDETAAFAEPTCAGIVLDPRTGGKRQFSWGIDRNTTGMPLGCALTPDGRTLLVACRGQTVRAYETDTGDLRSVGGIPCNATHFAVSPDGRLLAAAGERSFVAVVDWRGLARKGAPPDDAARARLWRQLGEDGQSGFSAVVELGSTPDEAAKLIGGWLPPVLPADPATVRRLVSDLGSDDYPTREGAEMALAKLGPSAVAALRAAAGTGDDPERRARAARLVAAHDARERTGSPRARRAVEVLEYVGTPAARAVLAKLAEGEPTADLTRGAAAALARLRATDPRP